ncbi:MAG: The GLUG motif protein [Syntrophorhabdaceae bacterium PtaU1.Bin034]|nr:MAG: The GLUG motif protein [Syntrophorhabdaceae bacterium PtaU1.Bin034]
MNDAVSWSANTTLTLLADNSININAPITASGDTAILILNAGKDININNAVTLEGANATLVMAYGGDYHILTKASYSGAVIGADGYPVAQVDPHDPANGGDGVYGSITFTNHDNKNGLTINGTPYTLIHTKNDLDNINSTAPDVNGYSSGNGYYALAGNLDLSGTTYTSSPITTLSRTLAGMGHVISNLTVNAPTGDVGLIGRAPIGSAAVIRDIGLVDVSIITGGMYSGALLGYSYGAAISGVYVTATDKDDPSTVYGTSAGMIGGLVGQAGYTTITDSYSDANVTVNSPGGGYTGGLVGQAAYTTITNAHTTGNVNQTRVLTGTTAGGLVGSGSVRVTNSYATGDVTSNGNGVGGLIGSSSGSTSWLVSVVNSFATGDVTGLNNVGGLIGSISGYASTVMATVDNCWATGNVKSTGNSVGGLIGTASYVNISNSHYTTGTVTTDATGGVSNMGGLVGYLIRGSITDSYATSHVIGNGASSYMGGLVGYLNNGSITRSYATGDVVNGADHAGGLAGSATGGLASTITDSWASGDVSGTNEVGGLTGGLVGTISNSYALGNVTGDKWVGGLVGAVVANDRSYIINSYAMGDVTGGDRVGGLAGDIGPGVSMSDSYFGGRVTGTGESVGALVGHSQWLDFGDRSGPNQITNTYWDADKNGQTNAVGRTEHNFGDVTVGNGDTILTGTQGLTTEQWPDLQYYRDGTIDQVLADRQAAADAAAAAKAAADAAAQQAAEESAARQAAFEADAGTQAGQTTGQALQRESNPTKETNGATVLAGQQQPSLDDHIVFAESSSYSATIKSISADEVEFKLEDDSRGEKK